MKRRYVAHAFVLLAACTVSACMSAGDGYGGLRSERDEQCQVFTGTERDQCLEQARTPYEDVEKQRREDSRAGS